MILCGPCRWLPLRWRTGRGWQIWLCILDWREIDETRARGQKFQCYIKLAEGHSHAGISGELRELGCLGTVLPVEGRGSRAGVLGKGAAIENGSSSFSCGKRELRCTGVV